MKDNDDFKGNSKRFKPSHDFQPQDRGTDNRESSPRDDNSEERAPRAERSFGGDRPPRTGGFDRPRPSFSGDRPRTGGFDRPRPSFSGDRPRTGGFDRPRPSFGGDRPPRSFEKATGEEACVVPSAGRFDRPRPSFGGDRPPRTGGFDRPRSSSFGGDRPRTGGFDRPRPSFGGERRSSSHKSDNRFGDKKSCERNPDEKSCERNPDEKSFERNPGVWNDGVNCIYKDKNEKCNTESACFKECEMDEEKNNCISEKESNCTKRFDECEEENYREECELNNTDSTKKKKNSEMGFTRKFSYKR